MNIKTTKKTKIKLLNPKCLPAYSTDGSAAMDCFANIDEPITLQPMGRFAVPLGFCVDLDSGWAIDVRPRSGFALKQGVTLANCVGLIDEDFTNELKAILINLGTEPVTVNPLDKVCQCQVKHVTKIEWEEVTDIRPRENSHDGFGSTSMKRV